MEIDLHATTFEQLDKATRHVLDNGWATLAGALGGGAREVAAWRRFVSAFEDELDDTTLKGLRLGHETCEFRVPSIADFEAGRALADWLGVRFTVALPPVYSVHEEECNRLLDSLAAGTYVACSDWGTVEMVRRRPGLIPLIGHTMNRMWRFERWPFSVPKPDLSHLEGVVPEDVEAAQLEFFSRCPILEPPALELPLEGPIGGLELDPVPQGVSIPADNRIPILLHAPWTYVTMGRRCVTRALVEGDGPVRVEPCSKPCLKWLVVARYEPTIGLLLQKGNAVYIENTSFYFAMPDDIRKKARLILTPIP